MFKNRLSFRPVICLAVSVLVLTATAPAQAKMYKWVDEKGHMHFGDSIPAKYMTKEHEELNEQGVTVKVTEAAKTREQLIEERKQEEARKKEEEERKKQAQRDRVLLDTYTTERDLVVARDARLDAVDSQINLSKSIIEDSQKNLKSLEKQVTNIKASNREVPQDLYRRVEIEKKQINVQTGVMKNHKKRREDIAKQFNGYIERFKVLKEEQKARREQLAKERGLE
jgi:hypothetical protein